MAGKRRVSPRQKMINLMYLVFIGMLAMNISVDVLNGFDLLGDNIATTIDATSTRNEQLYSELNSSYDQNPEKTKSSYEKSKILKQRSDSLFNYIQDLKVEIALKTDGKDADVNNLERREYRDAGSEVFLSPVDGKGKELKNAIDTYRDQIVQMIADPIKKTTIANSLSTEPTERAKRKQQSWLESSFENMPSIAVNTYLSELQSNIKQAEGEALNSLVKEIDLSDFRVNQLDAIVIPESKVVVRGANYKANIIVAAVDTTQRPRIVVNGKEIENGALQIPTSSVGNSFKVEGFLELMNRDGSIFKKKFTDTYTVIEPMATVAPLLMDVVYLGIDNEMSISVPGFTSNQVNTSVQGGTITRKGNNWVARPAGKVGDKLIVNVSVSDNGAQRSMARKEFRIRALPDPTAYINYTDSKGAARVFKQGTLSRNSLLSAGGIKASIDDGILNIPFQVLGFRLVVIDAMGNALPQELSNGDRLSDRQLEQIRRLDRGKTFFISGIRVKGPDGIERNIAPMEVRLN